MQWEKTERKELLISNANKNLTFQNFVKFEV